MFVFAATTADNNSKKNLLTSQLCILPLSANFLSFFVPPRKDNY